MSGLVALLILVSVVWPGAALEREDLAIESQRDSFCSLEWSIAEFKRNFNREFTELLLQAQRARTANATPLENEQIAQVLEDAITEARSAVPVDEMKEALLSFYRAARLTNKFQALFTELQTRNTNRVVLDVERRFLISITNSPSQAFAHP